MARILMMVLVLGGANATVAQDETDENLDIGAYIRMFELNTGCQAVGLVTGVQNESDQFELDADAVQNALESRLRSARLYRDDSLAPYLSVHIQLLGYAYYIRMELVKEVIDSESYLSGFAPTWTSGSLGTHGNDENYILGSVSRRMDEFLVEYLEANEEACASQ